jgi:ubiquinone/menaquinone biosynthesis C-methylase UbiE
MKYSQIHDYWNSNPCEGGSKGFPFRNFAYKNVLEIGCGMGVDSKRFVDNKVIYTGIDLTEKAVEITKQKTKSSNIYVMNAENLEFQDESFDLVYSWGVIHHALNPSNIMKEIYRVLKKDGHVCIMLYNKFSMRYILDIMFLRKILWLFKYHKFNIIRKALPYPTKEEWISINTDTLGCPMSRVYSKKEALELCKDFTITNTWTENKGWYRIIIGKK